MLLILGVVLIGGTALARQDPNLTPLVRGFASFVIPGLGQYLNGEYDKALTHFVVDMVLVLGTYYVGALLPYRPFPVYWMAGLAHTAWALYSAVDAYQTALRLEGLTLRVTPTSLALNF